ncbi:FecR family protein [Pedobacter sp.]|uniref:FecR family protein n=1 Tax=Pedobacter sp. TaxID=1411316 RepID=UPI003D7F39F5
MQENHIFQNLILNHLNEPDNTEIADQVNALREQSLANEQYFQEIKSVWEKAADTAVLSRIDKVQALHHFKSRLKDHIVLKPQKSYQWLSGVAAAAALVIAGVWLYSTSYGVKELVKETHAQVDSILLNDGSKVMLAQNTIVKYPDHFKGKTRDISLEKGKAFFKISKDPEHPFTISIGQSKVSVLGTSFNIKYTDSLIDVSVSTGTVRFTPNKVSKGAILNAGQSVSYNYALNIMTQPDGSNDNSWLTKELHFVDMPLQDVCKELSEYYGVKINLHDTVHTAKKFNANFKESSLNEILNVLKATYNIQVETSGDTVTIKSL